jgi:hypothetical protein
MAISNCGRRYFSVESWLRKANVDESAECATVGPAASVGNAVNPAIDMKDSNNVEEAMQYWLIIISSV